MTAIDDPSAVESAGRQRPLSQWDNEGGAIATPVRVLPDDLPELTNAELVHMRVRLIALENLMIVLLSQASTGQFEMAGILATHLAPGSGAAPHRLTDLAMHQMHDLVHRAGLLRDTPTA